VAGGKSNAATTTGRMNKTLEREREERKRLNGWVEWTDGQKEQKKGKMSE
jgi:hypothetical protein